MKNILNLKNKYYESYCDSKSLLPGLNINWMEQLRDQAIHQFNQDGLPDKNVEEWNICSFKGLTETFYNPFEKLNYDLDVDLIEKKKDNCLIRVIFYNGKIIKIEHDILPQGIKVNTLNFFLKNDPEFLKEKIKPANEFLEDRLSRITDSRPQSIVALNAAFHKEGAVICIDKNIKVINIANPEIIGTDLECCFLVLGISIKPNTFDLLINILINKKLIQNENNRIDKFVFNIFIYFELL